jgi:two-component system sensor histidine kinase DesK
MGASAPDPRGSRGLVRAASVGALAHVAYFPLQIVTTKPVVDDLTWRTAAVAAVATGVYAPLHVRHVRLSLRGTRPPAAAWTLVAMAAVIAGASPLAGLEAHPLPGLYWSTSCYALAGSALLVLRPRWAAGAFAASVGLAVALVFASGGDGGLTAYAAWVVGWRALSLFALVRLVTAVRGLHGARAALADEAVARERRDIDREINDAVGSALAAIAAEAHHARELSGTDAEASLQSLVEHSRRALADVRRTVGRYRRRDFKDELDTAVAVLAASGVAMRVLVRATVEPDDEPSLRAQLRPAVARLLADHTMRACTMTVERRDGHAVLECAPGEGDDIEAVHTRVSEVAPLP